jgi:hypothetical protein
VHPGHLGRSGIGRIRIVDNERQALRSRRRAAPGKRADWVYKTCRALVSKPRLPTSGHSANMAVVINAAMLSTMAMVG